MEVHNDYSWNIYRKEKGMAIRGVSSRQTNSTHYAPEQVKSVIQSIGISISSEPSNEIMFYCPFHSNKHTPSCSISKSTGAWLCFNPSCGESGNLIDLVKRVLNKNDFEAMRFISTKETESFNDFDKMLADTMQDKPDFIEFPKNVLDDLHNNLLNSSKAIEYFKGRNINQESIKYFELGYSEKQDMVVVPLHSPDGLPVGIIGRSIEGKSFKNSNNLPKSKTMFNIHRAKRIGNQVIVVESSFDAIRIHQAGFPNVVATLGGHISAENINLINRYFNVVTIMTDADTAGRELGRSISSRLRNKNILWASYEYGKIYPHGAKDAGDMTDEEIKTCIKNSVSEIEYRSWNS